MDKAALHIGAVAFIHRFGSSLNGHLHCHVWLRKEGNDLVFRRAKQCSEPPSGKRGAKADELHLTPLELIDHIAALAPNSPFRVAVTALAAPPLPATAQAEPTTTGEGAGAHGVALLGNAVPTQVEPAQPVPSKRPAHDLPAVLIARIYEVFPLLCPMCGGQMRLIAFITEGTQIEKILNHIGVDSEPPHIAPARGPPLWDGCDAQIGEGVEIEPDWGQAAQPALDFEVDQRVSW